MDKYRQVTSTIIAEMKERGYSNRSINNHSKIYETLNSHLELMEMAYSPDLGKAMLEEGSIDHFGIKGDFVRAAAIAKLNDVWLNGTLKNAAVSPRKPYSSIRLCAAFEASVSGFLEHCREDCGFFNTAADKADSGQDGQFHRAVYTGIRQRKRTGPARTSWFASHQEEARLRQP